LISGISENDLPTRRMSIAGIEGGLDARILSKDFSGPTTRLVRIPSGWGSDIPGLFTASVGLFVVKGGIFVGNTAVRAIDYVFLEKDRVVPGIRAEEPTLALVMTGAPVRYDTAAGGPPATLDVARYEDGQWNPQRGQSGRVVKPLWESTDESVWLGVASEWSWPDGPWHRHDAIEECFVLEGDVSFVEMGDDGPEAHRYETGGYVCRPAGALHVGPGSESSADTLTFHRTLGPLQTEWVTLDDEEKDDSEAQDPS